MFLQPGKTKHRKLKKGRLKNFEFKSNRLAFGVIGLKSTESGVISARQLEATRRAIVRKLNRKGKLWLRIFPHTPLTKKPNESRMGKGKGGISVWSAKIFGGQMIFELAGVSLAQAEIALYSGGCKLPVKTKICLI